MASLNLDGLRDFVEATLKKYKRKAWVDISLPLQMYYFSKRLFKDKTKKPEMSGPQCEWKLRIANQGNFKVTGLFAVDTTNRINVLTHADQPWAMTTTNYIYDLKEPAFQGGPETIIRYMDVNEQGLMNDFFAGMETLVWTAPNSVSQNPRPLSGIPFWLQKSATTGFNGGDPTGFPAGAGGISVANYPNWSNYTAAYSQVSRDDAVEKIINAMDFCYFEAPVDFAQLAGGQPDWGLYTTHPFLATCRKILQSQNDDLGDDVAAHSGKVYIRGTPVDWVPALNNSQSPAYDSSNPVYGVNWRTFEYMYQAGWSQVKHPPFRVANQHTVYMRCMDDTGQLICYDRRQNFVVYQNAT